MYVLGKLVGAVEPGGLVLDLQAVRPSPRIESGGRVVCELIADELFRKADAAAAAVDSFVAAGRLIEEAVDDHSVVLQFRGGRDVLADFDDRVATAVPSGAVPALQTLDAPCIRRDFCRLRRLRVTGTNLPE